MDRRRYLRETSQALRATEDRRQADEEAWLDRREARVDEAGARALERFASTLQAEGLRCDGERWHCPSCRSQSRELDFVLEVRLVGRQVELICHNHCRPNTIRALLGAPPYFPNGKGKGHQTLAKFPFR